MDVAVTGKSRATRPASISGRSSAMKAVEWQPGLAMRLAQRLALARREFGDAESPAGRHAVRGAGIDDAGVRVVDQRHRFAGRGIGQAQEGHVGGVEQACALGAVLALVGVDLQHLDVAARGQVLVDAQSGGAFLAVDEHEVLFHGASKWRRLCAQG
jgi:hypothetical protein